MKAAELLVKAIRSPQNLRFAELMALAQAFGYSPDRVRGSHPILIHGEGGPGPEFSGCGSQGQALPGAAVLRDIEEFNLELMP